MDSDNETLELEREREHDDLEQEPSSQQDAAPQKFFFHMNVFDDPSDEELEEMAAPTFSEDELEAAKKSAFQDGLNQGRTEAQKQEQESRETFVAQTLEKIAQETQSLFSAENERSTRFQHETIALTLHIFKKLFPALNKEHGFKELEDSLKSIIERQSSHPHIAIHVAKENVQGIEDSMKSLATQGTLSGNFVIHPSEHMQNVQARLQWENGGALKDQTAMATEIENLLTSLLGDFIPHESNEPEHGEKAGAPPSSAAEDTAQEDNPEQHQDSQGAELKNDPTVDTIE